MINLSHKFVIKIKYKCVWKMIYVCYVCIYNQEGSLNALSSVQISDIIGFFFQNDISLYSPYTINEQSNDFSYPSIWGDSLRNTEEQLSQFLLPKTFCAKFGHMSLYNGSMWGPMWDWDFLKQKLSLILLTVH